MEKFIKTHRLLAGSLSIVISVFMVSIVAYGATTIGTNIVTTGTASSTSATTTDYLYVGEDITEPAGWDFAGGDLIVSGAAYFYTKATSTTAFAVGSGTINNLDMADGDLYVQNDAEIDGGLYVNSATTTDSLVVGGYISATGDISTSGTITSTGSTTASIINMTTVKFTPSATPTPDVVGECFIDDTDYQLNCYDGSAWQQAW